MSMHFLKTPVHNELMITSSQQPDGHNENKTQTSTGSVAQNRSSSVGDINKAGTFEEPVS